MKEFVLLFATFLLLLYLFVNKDNPYIPIARRPKPYQTKRQIINWFAWKGPMFVEGFRGEGGLPLPSDPRSCAGNAYACKNKRKWLSDHQVCQKQSMKSCRVPSLTSEHSWRNEYQNCSYWMRGPNPLHGDLGNYAQCTNNNLDTPNNLKCVVNGRWDMDTCPQVDRVSPVCFKWNYNQCMNKKGHKIFK